MLWLHFTSAQPKKVLNKKNKLRHVKRASSQNLISNLTLDVGEDLGFNYDDKHGVVLGGFFFIYMQL